MKGFLDEELQSVINKQQVISFCKGKIKIPKEIITQVAPIKIRDIERERKEHLDGRKFGELSFKEFLKKHKGSLTIIEQYPIIIEKRDKWKGDPTQIMMYIDFFIPEWNVALEIDYPGTHDEEEDCLRDKYLSNLGIRVVRYNLYLTKGNEKITRRIEQDAELLLDSLNARPWHPEIKVDYNDKIIKDLEIIYSAELVILDEIRVRKGYWLVNYKLSKREFHDIVKFRLGNTFVDWRVVSKLASMGNIELTVE